MDAQRSRIGASYPGTSEAGLIILLGIEGCGKDTQGDLLAQHLDRPHYVTGNIVRSARHADPGFVQYIAQLDSAPYLDDAWINHFSSQYIEPGMIVNGTPRSVGQAEHLDRHWQTRCVLFYEIDPARATERMIARGKESGRADDTPEGIARRLVLSAQRVPQIIEYYSRCSKTPLHVVNADQPREDVFRESCAVLGISADRPTHLHR